MVIQHNLAGMNSNRQLKIDDGIQTKSMEKLASGYRINRAADDAAGLSISEKMRREVRGLTQGTNNCQDGISWCQIADGALTEIDNMLARVKELAVKSANEVLTTEDREFIDEEIQAISSEIDRIHATTTFNDIAIFDNGGNSSMDLFLQAGSNATEYEKIALQRFSVSTDSITESARFDVKTAASARNTIDTIHKAGNNVTTIRSYYGALQQRLEHAVKAQNNTIENQIASESRIRDTDMATESVAYLNQKVLNQSAQALLAQANASTQGVLSLIG